MVLKGKNILVTGGTGFIGSHLVKNLINTGANVIVTSRSQNPKAYFWQQNLYKKTILASVDLKDYQRTLDLISKYEVNLIYHLAAQPIVTTAYANPLETFESNILGTAHILEAARRLRTINGVVIVSSDKAYGKNKRAKETDPLAGDHPYETSKSAADLIASSYFKTFQVPVVIARFGNVYGEGDINFSRIIPGIMRAVVKGETLVIRSDGKFIRDYVYVADVVNAILDLVKNLNKVKGEAFNISSSENLSVIKLIKTAEKILDCKIKYQIEDKEINEIPSQSLNFTKINSKIGWQPKYNLNSTISAIFKWYKAYFEI